MNISEREFDIDYSTKFYPLAATKYRQTVYKVVYVMDAPIKPDILKQAVNLTLPRYPHMAVSLERNFFKFYMKHNPNEVDVYPMVNELDAYLDETKNNNFRFRVSYKDNLIQLDVFHILTDGVGIMEFVKSIAYCYCHLLGRETPDDIIVKDWRDEPTEDELEDGYVEHSKKIKLLDVKLDQFGSVKPIKIKGTPSKNGFLIKSGVLDASKVVKAAKERGVTVTAFLAGILAYSIHKTRESKQPVVMMIPVNLRPYYNSGSMRNYVSFFDMIFDPNKLDTIEDYMVSAKEQIKAKTESAVVEKMVNTSYTLMSLKIVKAAPLFLKKFAVKMYNASKKGRQTIVFTNLGRLASAEEVGIKNIIVNMNAQKNTPVNVATLTVGNNMSITFTRVIEEDLVSVSFFKVLKSIIGDFETFTRDDLYNGNYNLHISE